MAGILIRSSVLGATADVASRVVQMIAGGASVQSREFSGAGDVTSAHGDVIAGVDAALLALQERVDDLRAIAVSTDQQFTAADANVAANLEGVQ